MRELNGANAKKEMVSFNYCQFILSLANLDSLEEVDFLVEPILKYVSDFKTQLTKVETNEKLTLII